MDSEKQNYDVGYGKPPKKSQFTQGRSGNPKGRPKGSRSLHSIVAETANRKVTLTEGNRTRTVTLKEAVVTQLATKAARGDRYASKEFIQMCSAIEFEDQATAHAGAPNDREQAVWSNFLERAKRLHLTQIDEQKEEE